MTVLAEFALLVAVVVVAFCAAAGVALWLTDRDRPVDLDEQDHINGGASMRGAE